MRADVHRFFSHTQLQRAGRRLVFYGDDTWLRLFPGHFVRSEGTTSFFVTDYTEVRVCVRSCAHGCV